VTMTLPVFTLFGIYPRCISVFIDSIVIIFDKKATVSTVLRLSACIACYGFNLCFLIGRKGFVLMPFERSLTINIFIAIIFSFV